MNPAELKAKSPVKYALASLADSAIMIYTLYLMGKYLYQGDIDMFLKAMTAHGVWCISHSVVKMREGLRL